MKNLSNIIGIFLFLGFSIALQAENIDECKSDLYFANGIMMKYSEKDALDMWKEEADDLLISVPTEYEKIANVKIAYNVSQGFLDDLLESFEQVISNEWGWRDFSVYFTNYLKIHGIQELDFQHNVDLAQHITAYKDSIKLGHSVILIAHSQGNYFTNEAYEYLDDWMKPYFHMMGVATPANHVAGYEVDDSTAPYLKFHNDMIKSVAGGLPTNRDNPNVEHNSVFSVEAHDFYSSYLSAANTRQDIHDFILNKIHEHEIASTQWETNEEYNLNTCDYKVTVKHRHDPSIEMPFKVYPFNASKKLYQVNEEWVKASCGGENILGKDHDIPTWDGKQDNECLMIDNPEEEKIINRKLTLVTSYHGYLDIIGSTGFSYSEPIAYASIYGLTVFDSKVEKVVNVIEQQFDTCLDKLSAAKKQLIIAKEYAQNYLEEDVLKVKTLYPEYIIQFEFYEYMFQEDSCSCAVYPNSQKTCYGLISVGVNIYK